MVMNKIKIGRNTYTILQGDYVMYNKACYQFVAGDGRALKYDGYNKVTAIILPKIVKESIPLYRMKVIEKGSIEQKNLLTKWYF